ncbi:ATP-binding cassette domain-containing protein [Agromyces bracchium]|uniref:ATP-binding cassette domain-containing protein n=1 Tax=Agromyces bracchium TaxID=88376 RepID=A0A6I3MBZ6_9MICO|nr:ATP-binding cassette domain-containing protein [Agromyces bracchium]
MISISTPAPSAVEAPVVRLHDVSKRFILHTDKSIKERVLYFRHRETGKRTFWALDGIDLTIELGETVGLIGHNGSGKSTLLKVIGGIIDASSGVVERRGRVAALLELGAGFHPDLTGRENVYLNAAILGMSRAETDVVFDDIVDFSGIGEFIDSQVKFYSSGMYVRLAFAVAVHSDPDLLLVDEVLAVGDEPFQNKCMAKIRQFQREGRTIVLVSHSADQVADVCTRAVVLDSGSVVYDGDVAEGIRVLREGYERDRIERSQATALRDHAPAEPAIDVIEATITSIDGTPITEPVTPGTDLAITIRALVRRPTEWITGFTLSTPLGQAVYRLNSEGLGMELPSEPGEYLVRFDVAGTNFAVAQLVLSAGATTLDGEILAQLDPAGRVDFTADPHAAGFVQFATRGEVAPASALR